MGHVPLLDCGMVTPSLRPILRAFGNRTSVEMLTECSVSLGPELASAGVIVWAQGMYGSASFFLFVFAFWDRVAQCSPGCPETLETQADLKARDLPVSASHVLGLNVCAITVGQKMVGCVWHTT